MTKKIKVPKASIGYGYIGVWSNGSIGWCGVTHMGSPRKYPD